MNNNAIVLHGLAYVTGDTREEVANIDDVAAKFAAIQLPFLPELLNCQYYFRHTGGSGEIAAWVTQSIQKTLIESQIAPSDIQRVIFASAQLPAPLQNPCVLNNLLSRAKLNHATPMAVTLQECTSGLGAIHTAQALMRSLNEKHTIVVCIDVADDKARIQPFGVLSDAVSSCVLSHIDNLDEQTELHSPNVQSPSFKLLSYANTIDSKGLASEDDFDSRKAAATQSFSNALNNADVTKDALKHICSTNFYQPLADFNAQALQLNKQLLRINTAKSHGHCVCSDPLINLLHSTETIQNDEIIMLQAYAPGFVTHIVLKALIGEAEEDLMFFD